MIPFTLKNNIKKLNKPVYWDCIVLWSQLLLFRTDVSIIFKIETIHQWFIRNISREKKSWNYWTAKLGIHKNLPQIIFYKDIIIIFIINVVSCLTKYLILFIYFKCWNCNSFILIIIGRIYVMYVGIFVNMLVLWNILCCQCN